VSANKSYNVFFNKIKTRNIQNLNPIRLLISSPGGFMDFGLFFNGAAATFDYRILENKSYNTQIEQILELECFRTTGWVSDLYLWNIFYCNDDDDRPNTAKFYMRRS